MNIIKKLLGIIPVLFCLLLVGCGGYSKEQVEQTKALQDSITNMVSHVQKQETSFQSLAGSKDWSFLDPYSKKESWSQYFKNATSSISKAQELYDNDITALLKENDRDQLTVLDQKRHKLKKHLKSAKEYATKADKRIKFLLNARKDAPKWIQLAEANFAKATSDFNGVDKKASKVKKDYPVKSEDITGRVAGIRKVVEDSSIALKQAQNQLSRISSGSADYAVLGDSVNLVAAKQKDVESMSKNLSSKLDELYRSYSKILTDMRIEYFVEVGRSSWDDSSDSNTEKTYTYKPSPVTEETYTYFESLSEGTAATRSRGWGSWSEKVNINQNMWKALKIDMNQQWPSRYHNASEFWINNYFANTYHKYLIVENGVKKETDWQKVPEDSYWKQEENLGLEITSKPYGMYEEEVLQSAAPPGMAYIAKPTVNNGQATGKNQYGEWRQDSSGTSFWHYYGQYAFISNLLGPSHSYSYNDWDSYSRRDRNSGYYGRNDRYGTYGSSTYKSKRYKNSGYAKRNPNVVKSSTRTSKSTSRKSAGKSQTASIRGSGPSSRGKGPGGGGK